jgi:dolichol kinase
MIRTVKEGELGRKAIHYLSSLIPLVYQFCYPRQPAILISGVLFLGIVVAEMLRMNFPVLRRTYWKIFGGMIRPREFRNHFTGATYVFMGAFLAIFFFPKEIAVTSLLFLTVGDPTACLVGLSVGRIRIYNHKTLEGGIAFVVGSVLATVWIGGIPFWIKVVGAIVACCVEVLHRRIDDNVLIPLFSGTTMLALVELLEFL